MDRDEVCIVRVEENSDLVCLLSRKNSDPDCVQLKSRKGSKGKEPANSNKNLTRKRPRDQTDDVMIIGGTTPPKKLPVDCLEADTVVGDKKEQAEENKGKATHIQAAEQLAKQLMFKDIDDIDIIPPISTNDLFSNIPGPSNSGTSLERMPTCWSTCPKCLPSDIRKYHLIDVPPDTTEWNFVSEPLTKADFDVLKVQRIQNESLWQRLMYEKKLMLRDRSDVNEQFLYHTSRAEPAVICEEGLDLRLSRNGCFGTGIYFSDNPVKCNRYWSRSGPKQMFLCRVLLGSIKVYPVNQYDRALVREPLKERPKPGEPKTYDSVKGSVAGLCEFIVYNAYRVMPEYLIEYSDRQPSYPTTALSTSYGFSNVAAAFAQALSQPVRFARPKPKSRSTRTKAGKSKRKGK